MHLIKELSDWELSVVTVVSRTNVHELEQIHDHLINHGCVQWRLQLATPAGRMDHHRDQMFTDEEFESFVDRVLTLQKSSPIRITCGTNIGYHGTKSAELHYGMPFTGDYLGMRVVSITANGDVKGDLPLSDDYTEGNIREQSFTEIWKSDDAFAYNRKFNMDMVKGFCRECRYLPLCKGGDASSSLAVSGVRANAPYCMYRIEHARGEEPIDSELTTSLLKQVGGQRQEAAVAR